MMKRNFLEDMARYLCLAVIIILCKMPNVGALLKKKILSILVVLIQVFIFILKPYIDLRSATCMFDVLRRKLSTTSAYPHLLSVLHHMLLVPSELSFMLFVSRFFCICCTFSVFQPWV